VNKTHCTFLWWRFNWRFRPGRRGHPSRRTIKRFEN